MDRACPLMHVLCICPLEEFILRSGVLSRTLSNTWWRLCLPIFLFSAGLLILMYIDSFIILARPWSSLPMILKLSGVVLFPVRVLHAWMGEGSFRCSLYLSSRVLDVSPYVFFIAGEFPTLAHVDSFTFLLDPDLWV